MLWPRHALLKSLASSFDLSCIAVHVKFSRLLTLSLDHHTPLHTHTRARAHKHRWGETLPMCVFHVFVCGTPLMPCEKGRVAGFVVRYGRAPHAVICQHRRCTAGRSGFERSVSTFPITWPPLAV
jgi:hypothetical protein